MTVYDQDVTQTILALEREALKRWSQGDPSGFLEITAPDVVYFDPFLDRRIDGRAALAAYYEGLRGKIRAEENEIIDPVVQERGGMAVLTYTFRCRLSNGSEQRWNSTEVYRRDQADWRIIQSHWSLTKSTETVLTTPS